MSPSLFLQTRKERKGERKKNLCVRVCKRKHKHTRAIQDSLFQTNTTFAVVGIDQILRRDSYRWKLSNGACRCGRCWLRREWILLWLLLLWLLLLLVLARRRSAPCSTFGNIGKVVNYVVERLTKVLEELWKTKPAWMVLSSMVLSSFFSSSRPPPPISLLLLSTHGAGSSCCCVSLRTDESTMSMIVWGFLCLWCVSPLLGVTNTRQR